jgi:hypothetical protein
MYVSVPAFCHCHKYILFQIILDVKCTWWFWSQTRKFGFRCQHSPFWNTYIRGTLSHWIRPRREEVWRAVNPGVNFINILLEPFLIESALSSFSLIKNGFATFVKGILAQKLIIKCWWNWLQDEKDKKKVREQKVKAEFREKLGLIVDQRRDGGAGNTTTGNVARRALSNPGIIATGYDK